MRFALRRRGGGRAASFISSWSASRSSRTGWHLVGEVHCRQSQSLDQASNGLRCGARRICFRVRAQANASAPAIPRGDAYALTAGTSASSENQKPSSAPMLRFHAIQATSDGKNASSRFCHPMSSFKVPVAARGAGLHSLVSCRSAGGIESPEHGQVLAPQLAVTWPLPLEATVLCRSSPQFAWCVTMARQAVLLRC